jgi:hypothetical protein
MSFVGAITMFSLVNNAPADCIVGAKLKLQFVVLLLLNGGSEGGHRR